MRQSKEAFFCDWSTHGDGKLVETEKGAEKTGCKMMMDTGGEVEQGFNEVIKEVPKNFTAALQDKIWGEPARKELSGLMDKKTLMVGAATDDIRYCADLVVLFPVYEKMIKD